MIYGNRAVVKTHPIITYGYPKKKREEKPHPELHMRFIQ
jgi:transposase